MKTKICSKCKGDPKPLSEFNKQGSTNDGLTYWCTQCMRDYQMKRYWDNPVSARDRVREWRKANPKRVKETNDKWRKANPGYDLQWKRKNKDHLNEYQRNRRKLKKESII